MTTRSLAYTVQLQSASACLWQSCVSCASLSVVCMCSEGQGGCVWRRARARDRQLVSQGACPPRAQVEHLRDCTEERVWGSACAYLLLHTGTVTGAVVLAGYIFLPLHTKRNFLPFALLQAPPGAQPAWIVTSLPFLQKCCPKLQIVLGGQLLSDFLIWYISGQSKWVGFLTQRCTRSAESLDIKPRVRPSP